MSHTVTYAAVHFPGVPPFPSANVLQWTEDGQAVVITKNTIYILTPSSGIPVDPTLFVKQSGTNARHQVQWLRTVIEWEAVGELRQWPADCQDWGAVALGYLDPCFRDVACSPSNLSTHASCLLAVLTSNLQVSIWSPVKNQLTGKWVKVEDFDDFHYYSPPHDAANSSLCRTLQAQVTSISWSTQVDFLVSPTPDVDGSLLAIGSRAGIVSFARFTHDAQSEGKLRHTASLGFSDRWIVQIAWSPWKSSHPGQCEAYIACVTSDGSVKVLEVIQILQQSPSPFAADLGIIVECRLLDTAPPHQGKRAITSLRWFQVQKEKAILAFGTPGEVHIWCQALATYHVISLQTITVSVGSSCSAPISGMQYNHPHDALIISLADGSFQVIYNVSVDPTLGSPNPELGLIPEAITAKARSTFLNLEDSPSQKDDVNRIYGMAGYDNKAIYAWIHEHVRPTDFDYKHDAKRISTLVVAELWQGVTDDSVLGDLTEIMSTIKAAKRETPLAHLRPVLLHLDDPERFLRLRNRILDIAHQPELPDGGTALPLPPWTGELHPQVRDEFVKSLRTHLFGWYSLHRLRAKFFLATFCKTRTSSEAHGQFDEIITSIARSVQCSILLALLRHVMAMSKHISQNEVPFVLRVLVQALSISDLVEEAQKVLAELRSTLPTVDNDALNTDELCPACHAPVPFTNSKVAVCPRGHSWQRCSITSFILSTSMVRTCLGCNRKAFLPAKQDATSANWLPVAARSWLVEDLLDAVRRCLYCGNNFVTLV